MKCFDLTGKVAFLTGAAGNLGEVFAKALAEAGATMFLTDINEEGLKKGAEEIRALGRECDYCILDVSDTANIEAAVQACIDRFGKVDICVNLAAMLRDNRDPFEIDEESYGKVVYTNVVGSLAVAKACAKDMMKRNWGRIVNIGSLASFVVLKGVHGGAYETSKAAVVMLSKTLATEWRDTGICVNTIAPGYFGTQSNKNFFNADPEFYGKVIDMIPMARLGEPEELVGALILLCSDASSYMQGETISVDGGYACW